MLKLVNISKAFPQRGLVLDNLCFNINGGESISITGPSGSGKTTLMNIIGSLDRPDSGDVVFMGKSILGLNPDQSALYRNRNIGFVFQDHLLLPHLTIKENIMLPLLAYNISDQQYAETDNWVSELIRRTGIDGITNKYPSEISGGEAQRATLIRALVNKPSLLLADEPTGSLDAGNADLLGNLLVEMNIEYGITLIAATHSADLASKLKINLKLDSGKLTN